MHRALEIQPSRLAGSAIWHEIGRAHALQYEGEPFWTAMERAFECSPDRAIQGELYAELAFDVSARGGMCPSMPPRELVNVWIDRALQLPPAPSRQPPRAPLPPRPHARARPELGTSNSTDLTIP